MAAPNVQAILADLNAGRFKQAFQAAKKAMAKAPRDAGLPSLAALALTEMGRSREAVPLFQKAMKLDPGEPGHATNLLQALVGICELEKASSLADKLLEKRPGDAGVLYLAAIALARQNKEAEALARAGEAIAADPDNPRIRTFRGGVLSDLGRYRDALSDFEAALELAPDSVETLASMAKALTQLNRYEEAEARLNRAMAIAPDNLLVLKNSAVVLGELGRLDDAARAYAALFERAPDDAEVALEMANLAAKDDLDQLRKMLAARQKKAQRKSRDFALFGFAKARAAERGGDMEDARANWGEANATMARLDPVDEGALESEAAAIIETFTKGMPEPAKGDDGPVPIIIAGLPRSGTTLTEQIISAHPDIAGCGELPTAPRLVQDMQASGEVFDPELFAARYRAEVPDHGAGGHAFTDKMPMNFRYLGYLAAAFPKARFVHVARDPRDSVLSMWQQSFAARQMRYAYSLEALAAETNRYGRYMRLWRDVLGERLLDMPYEDIVSDVEAASRRLADHVGVEWVAEMARPEANAAPVRTASVSQVRQPVHSGSVGKWKAEAGMLKPFLERLDPAIWPDLR